MESKGSTWFRLIQRSTWLVQFVKFSVQKWDFVGREGEQDLCPYWRRLEGVLQTVGDLSPSFPILRTILILSQYKRITPQKVVTVITVDPGLLKDNTPT